ncbi:MAG: hypothetical protein JWP12_2953 [Bacteroidetes bacterium]|nr:hypothetical protein [Bacteroidota bacterium]
MKKIIMLLLGICCLFKVNAQLIQTIDLSTGVNSAGSVMPLGSTEDTWSLSSPTGALKTVQFQGSGWPTAPDSRWISPYYDGAWYAQPGASGNYIYKMTFWGKDTCILNDTIKFPELAADNQVTSISVNSTSHSLSAGITSLSNLTIPLTPGEIVVGQNTITITVYNNPSTTSPYTTWTGLFIHGSLKITYSTTALVPSFTSPSSVCFGSPITLNGTASSGPANDHVWTVVECDASGVPASGATTWWSPFYSGMPGTYTIPTVAAGGPTITCGKYYLIKLALQNNCSVWSETVKVIHINCLPTVNAGPDDTICSGSCVTIGTGGRTQFGVTYEWNGTSLDPAPTTKQITVCPTTTTTYTLTATNTSTGCTASDIVTIHVAPFIAAYFTGASYFCYGDALTFNATGSTGGANDYVWTVIECTSTGVSVSGGLAWWSSFYPGMPGIYTIPTAAAGGPAVICGKYYEIKLALQNDCNGWAPYTKIIYIACAPCGGQPLAGKTPSLNKSLMTDNSEMLPEFNIYPNPGNGIFNIESNTTDKTIMEVFDMLGNKVKSVEMTGHYQLDLSGYSKGIYMIKMTVNGQQINKKIILE